MVPLPEVFKYENLTLQTISGGVLVSWKEYLITSKQVLAEELFPGTKLLGSTFTRGVLINGYTGFIYKER